MISFVSLFFLTLACSCADHNILFARYFAADEAQTLDALFRNESGAVEGRSIPFIGRHICAHFTDYDNLAALTEFGKTREQISTHKCAITWPEVSF